MNPIFIAWVSFLGLLTSVHSKTNSNDVSALNVMFKSLNSPGKLTNWQSSGGDPCGDSWKGISCSGSSVTEIKLSGLGLTGSLGYQLSSLKSVTYLDVSKNKMSNDIPYQLPPNLQHLDLSKNGFSSGIPYSISEMKYLKYLDLSNNKLNGQLQDMFKKLQKLETLDVSKNKLTSNLPESFASLSSLSKLYLQNNQFTGDIKVLRNLAKLKLQDVNLSNNKFSGWIPYELASIDNFEAGGNSWSTGQAPPGMTSGDNVKSNSNKNKVSSTPATVAVIVIGVLVVIALLLAFLKKRRSSFSSSLLDESDSHRKPFHSYNSSRYQSKELGAGQNFKDFKPSDSSISVDINSLQSSGPLGLKASLSSRFKSLMSGDLPSAKSQRKPTFEVLPYALADLQNATSNFATSRLLGEGSIGRVYKAKYPDGKALAVKKINSTFFQDGNPDKFSATVSHISRFDHPNVGILLGYCSEQGHNMLVYEYYRNGSLYEFLHLSSEFSKPLTWNTRVRIALGTARAVEYLHESFSPPLVHRSIKSSNILLDFELNSQLLDSGLADFYEKATENLTAGYNVPESARGANYTLKSDVYSFGVVMLELLTGRMPFDRSKSKAEQYVVQWAMPQLHDTNALEKMVDPALRGLYPPKSVSRMADIIALCVQTEPEFRPPMSQVVQSLSRLVQQHGSSKRHDEVGHSGRLDDYGY